MNVEKVGVAVAEATTDVVMSIHVESFVEAGFSIQNTGTTALDVFSIFAKFSKNGPEVALATVAGDFTTPLYPIRRADALGALGAGVTGKLFLALNGIHTLIFKASSAVSATTLNISGQCN